MLNKMHVERFVLFGKTTICLGRKSNMAAINTEHVFLPLDSHKELEINFFFFV